jgi:AbrB family looped-hinge helix DNA binding protein
MAAIGTISSKGQVTVPVEVRRRLGVKEGDRIEFVFDGEQTVVRPVRPEGNPFTKWIGATGRNMPEGTAVAWVREMRDLEDTEG